MRSFSQTIREAGELISSSGKRNQLRRTSTSLDKWAKMTPPTSLAVRRAEQRPIYTLVVHLTAHHHGVIGGSTRATYKIEQRRKAAKCIIYKRASVSSEREDLCGTNVYTTCRRTASAMRDSGSSRPQGHDTGT